MAKILLPPEDEIGDGLEVATGTVTELEVVPTTPAGEETGTTEDDAMMVELRKIGAVVGTTGAVVGTAQVLQYTELVV